MSGAGNDFVLIGEDQARDLGTGLSAWVRRVCRRGLSIGADGVLIVGAAGPARVRVRFLNPDGGEAFCGNGSRCAARFARLEGLVRGDRFTLETAAGAVEAEILGSRVRLALGPPRDLGSMALATSHGRFEGRAVAAGVPHFVVFLPEIADVPLCLEGPELRRHPAFGPDGTNVDFASRGEGDTVLLRTWERGVEAETLSCGTGAVAAAFAARLQGAGATVDVVPRSGIRLTVALAGPREAPTGVTLEGDARLVLEGTLSSEGVEGFDP
jgi:diaminopimelate epimerase